MVSVCRDSQPPVSKITPKSYGEVSRRKYSGEADLRPSLKLFENEYELRTLIRTRFHFYCAALSTQYDGWLAAVVFVFELLVFHVLFEISKL
jgi:hypothetical protein